LLIVLISVQNTEIHSADRMYNSVMLNMAVHKTTVRLCVVETDSDIANNLLMNYLMQNC
jgi:hypothetical protein